MRAPNVVLTDQRLVKAALRNRWPQFLAQAVLLAGFAFTILVGLLCSPVGNANFAIVFVWIAWWSVLKLILIPFGGRAWCSVCPIPLPGEWLQRGALLAPQGRGLGLGWPWPRRLRGVWLQVGGFALIGLFSAVILTEPRVTAWVLLGLIGAAILTSLIFERRAFCRYLCPIGGFTGLYARLAPFELRAKDRSVCAAHGEKLCYTGCSAGFGCAWGNCPGALRDNATCGLCFECLRSCPHDNLAVRVRPFGKDLSPRAPIRLDEGVLALLMLGSVLFYSAVFLGPWGALKSAAYGVGSGLWWGYAACFLATTLILLPGLFFVAVQTGLAFAGARQSWRQAFARQSQALIPLGLMAWIAFTVGFAFVKFPYVLAVASDPLDRGWNLLGAISLTSLPDLSGPSALLQAVILIVGMFWSTQVAARMSVGSGRWPLGQALPVVGYCLLFTLSLLGLLIG